MSEKKYYEFTDVGELNSRLKYWSNACGDLHHHGEYDLKDVSELPEELQRAYLELWYEGNGCLEYLAEFDGRYYIALISEFDNEYANSNGKSMEQLYDQIKMNALSLYRQELFKDTDLVMGKETGLDGCHEIMFLVPAMESKDIYDAIENSIYKNL